MGKISKPMPPLFPQSPQCLIAVYGEGNYTVSGGANSCVGFGDLHTTTGDYQRIEVYNERCHFINAGVPSVGCLQQPDRVYIFALTNSCKLAVLHIENRFSLIAHTITKNYDIEPVFCGGAICSNDSCRVDCAIAPDGFCCIDHSFTNLLLQVLQN